MEINRRGFLTSILAVPASLAIPVPDAFIPSLKTVQEEPVASAIRLGLEDFKRDLNAKADRLAEYVLYENNNDITRRCMINELRTVADDYLMNRVLYQYRIVCDNTNNSAEIIDANKLKLDVYVQPSMSLNYVLFQYQYG